MDKSSLEKLLQTEEVTSTCLWQEYSENNSIHQKAWINNFVELAEMHHNYRVNNHTHPIEYYAQVKAQLDTCLRLLSHNEEL